MFRYMMGIPMKKVPELFVTQRGPPPRAVTRWGLGRDNFLVMKSAALRNVPIWSQTV